MRYLTVLYMNDRPTNITHPFNHSVDAQTYANHLGDDYRVMSEDEKLFNVQIIKGNWGRASWLYRDDDDEVGISFSADNNDSNQQWTLEQIKEYGIDDETVYKRVPVED